MSGRSPSDSQGRPLDIYDPPVTAARLGIAASEVTGRRLKIVLRNADHISAASRPNATGPKVSSCRLACAASAIASLSVRNGSPGGLNDREPYAAVAGDYGTAHSSNRYMPTGQTIFLDEINDFSWPSTGCLLRAVRPLFRNAYDTIGIASHEHARVHDGGCCDSSHLQRRRDRNGASAANARLLEVRLHSHKTPPRRPNDSSWRQRIPDDGSCEGIRLAGSSRGNRPGQLTDAVHQIHLLTVHQLEGLDRCKGPSAPLRASSGVLKAPQS